MVEGANKEMTQKEIGLPILTLCPYCNGEIELTPVVTAPIVKVEILIRKGHGRFDTQ